MKRRFFWLVALAGLVWLYLRRGARRPQPVDHAPPAADPADELESHLDMPEPVDVASPTDSPEPLEPPAPAGLGQPSAPAEHGQPSAPVVTEELDARRREIHERARSAADEMHGTSSDD